MICPISQYGGFFLCYALKVFLVIWIVFVPVVITARLEKIIKLLEDLKKK